MKFVHYFVGHFYPTTWKNGVKQVGVSCSQLLVRISIIGRRTNDLLYVPTFLFCWCSTNILPCNCAPFSAAMIAQPQTCCAIRVGEVHRDLWMYVCRTDLSFIVVYTMHLRPSVCIVQSIEFIENSCFFVCELFLSLLIKKSTQITAFNLYRHFLVTNSCLRIHSKCLLI